MKSKIKAGGTSITDTVFCRDTSVTTKVSGLTGLAFNTAGLTLYYRRESANSDVAVTLVTATLGTWTSGGFVKLDDTNMPGQVEIGFPNAAVAAGAKYVTFALRGATNMEEIVWRVELDAVDYQDAVRFGMSAIPNIAAGNSGGVALAADGIGRPALAANAITNTQFANNAITSSVVATSAVTAIAAGVWNALTSGITTVGSIGVKFVNWVLGSDSKVLLSTDAQTGVTIPTVTTLTNDPGGITTLLGRLTAARGGYLDNLNVGGNVASHADITAINQSASKHMTLATVGQYAPGETYTIEMRTYLASDGSAVNADTTPTLTATGNVSGDLSPNLSVASNPATGVYRWTYTPGATPTLEQIRLDGSATITSATFTLASYTQIVDQPTATFTTTDKSNLAAVFNKLPSGNIADQTTLSALRTDYTTARAVKIDHLDADITSRASPTNITAASGVALTSAYDAAKTAAQAGNQMDLVNAPNAVALTAMANALLDLANAVDAGGIDTVRKTLRIILATTGAKVSGAGTTINTFRDTADTKNRVVATVDTSGNRTGITYNGG